MPAVLLSSDKKDKGSGSPAASSSTKATAKPDVHSTGTGTKPRIGIQGMRVLSSLTVAGWSLAGGGGARSAHVMKEEREPQVQEKGGTSSQLLIPSDIYKRENSDISDHVFGFRYL